MTPERWAQVRQVFDSVVEKHPADVTAFLTFACAGDADLRKEVESLLRSYEQSHEFLSDTMTSVGRAVMGLTEGGEEYNEGYRVGPYELKTRIGRGGMGSVWAAVRADRAYEKQVAIKLVKRGMDTAEILKRFHTERQLLASLDHPNIARLLDGGSTADGLPYLVMEFVEGTPIDRYCEEGKRTVTERLRLFREVCLAVQYAHQNLIVHRDLKPGNILVTRDGMPKLLDFGIAKLLTPGYAQLSTLTLPHQRPMTLDYASPEQVRGEPITTASDVYSLGVLLYKLLTGKLPYRLGGSPTTMERAICETEPEKPSDAVSRETGIVASGLYPAATQKMESAPETREKRRKRLRRKLRGDLDLILLKALRKEPQRRYASVEQFSEDISRYLDGLPIRARKDTLGYRFRKFLTRNKVTVAASVFISVSLIGSAVVSFTSFRAARSERERAERYLNDARDLARFLFFDFDQAIQSGLTPGRQAAVATALQYLNRLKRDAAPDPGLRRELMMAYLRVGEVQESLGPSGIGDAVTSMQEAVDIAEALVRSDPNSTAAKQDLAGAHGRLAEAFGRAGAKAEAAQHYRRAIGVIETLSGADPRNADYSRKLSELRNRLGELQ